jgi:orotidine-5'-phosphate decarboxylase
LWAHCAHDRFEERTQMEEDILRYPGSDSPAAARVIVALDCPVDRALELADLLAGRATWLKVGMTLFYAEGPAIVGALKARGFKVFVDLKLHDIPHQVEGAARSVARLGADMFTVHAVGGSPMMEAAVRGAAAGFDARIASEPPLALAVTVLTSMDAGMLAQTGIQRPLASQVDALAHLALGAGMNGVVASPQEATALRAALGERACIVTPGVRPLGASLDDQSRVATPAQAFESGSSHVVVGRPITQASDPAAAFDALVADLV